MFVFVFWILPDLEGYLMREWRWCFPLNPTGFHVYFPKIHLVSKCVCSPNPAGQQVCAYRIHLILTSVFPHFISSVCNSVMLGPKRHMRFIYWHPMNDFYKIHFQSEEGNLNNWFQSLLKLFLADMKLIEINCDASYNQWKQTITNKTDRESYLMPVTLVRG